MPSNPLHSPNLLFTDYTCEQVRAHFSGYLDGDVTGVAMAAIAHHLDGCNNCAEEFESWRVVQQSVASLGPAAAPPDLQHQLRSAIAFEREQGTHLTLVNRFLDAWSSWLAPAALRLSGAFAAAVMLVAGLGWMFAAPLTVQANDDNMAHLIAPHFLYSQVPPQPIALDRDAPILVDAKVDPDGRVYDFSILAGPGDRQVQRQVEQNLLTSVFKPATVFGVPVRGHVVMTYMGVSVHG